MTQDRLRQTARLYTTTQDRLRQTTAQTAAQTYAITQDRL